MNPYEILGVDKSADLSAVKLRYRILAQKLHPDKGGDEGKLEELRQAYDI